jgi:hypothetical protein
MEDIMKRISSKLIRKNVLAVEIASLDVQRVLYK